jgi:hypothetical protein
MTMTNFNRSTGISFADEFLNIWKLIFMQSSKSKKSTGELSDCSSRIEGKYANYFKIGYNAFEFVFDFGQNYTENDEAELYTRIILAPVFAKALFDTLQESIEKYENEHGHTKEE